MGLLDYTKFVHASDPTTYTLTGTTPPRLLPNGPGIYLNGRQTTAGEVAYGYTPTAANLGGNVELIFALRYPWDTGHSAHTIPIFLAGALNLYFYSASLRCNEAVAGVNYVNDNNWNFTGWGYTAFELVEMRYRRNATTGENTIDTKRPNETAWTNRARTVTNSRPGALDWTNFPGSAAVAYVSDGATTGILLQEVLVRDGFSSGILQTIRYHLTPANIKAVAPALSIPTASGHTTTVGQEADSTVGITNFVKRTTAEIVNADETDLTNRVNITGSITANTTQSLSAIWAGRLGDQHASQLGRPFELLGAGSALMRVFRNTGGSDEIYGIITDDSGNTATTPTISVAGLHYTRLMIFLHFVRGNKLRLGTINAAGTITAVEVTATAVTAAITLDAAHYAARYTNGTTIAVAYRTALVPAGDTELQAIAASLLAEPPTITRPGLTTPNLPYLLEAR